MCVLLLFCLVICSCLRGVGAEDQRLGYGKQGKEGEVTEKKVSYIELLSSLVASSSYWMLERKKG